MTSYDVASDTYLAVAGGTGIPRAVMSDYLHPSLAGYRALAACIGPVLGEVAGGRIIVE